MLILGFPPIQYRAVETLGKKFFFIKKWKKMEKIFNAVIIILLILVIALVIWAIVVYKKERFKNNLAQNFMNCGAVAARTNKGEFSLKEYLDPVFNGSLQGTVIYPQDSLYGYAAQAYNIGIRQAFPGAVVFCRTVKDVVACVKTACKWNITVHIRCGRHDYGGFSSGGGMIIDISRMKKISVDTNTKIVTAGPGMRLGEIYPALQRYGLTINGGTCPGVGLAGLILGGGAGPFERIYGMLCDMMVSATVVLADGSIIKADKNNNSDLFWALKGGGAGNFGVVVQFEIQAFDIPDNGLDYHINWIDWNDTPDIFMAYQNLIANLDIDAIWVRLFMMSTPGSNQQTRNIKMTPGITHTGIIHNEIEKIMQQPRQTNPTAKLFLAVHYLGDIGSLKKLLAPLLQTGKIDWSSETYATYNKATFMNHIADWGACGNSLANCGDFVANVPVPGDQSIIISNPFGIETKIQLRASNGKWVSVSGSNNQLLANKNTPSTEETFIVKAIPDPWNVQKIQLKAYNGKWVSAEGGGGAGLYANKNTPSNSETFGVGMPWHSYDLQLQTSDGQWVGIVGNRLSATLSKQDPNALFHLATRPPSYTSRPNAEANRYKSLFGGINKELGRKPSVVPRAAIEFITKMLPTYPGPGYGGMMLVDSTGGQQARITNTAYAHRTVLWITQLMANYEEDNAEQKRTVIQWMRDLHEGLVPYTRKASIGVPLAYRNYADLDVKYSGYAYYEDNIKKLVEIKNKYDPGNFFTYPQAIMSTVDGTGSTPSSNIPCYDSYHR